MSLRPSFLVSCGLAALLLATPAVVLAQPSTVAPTWASQGYNGAATTTAAAFDPSTRDASNNRVVINGEIQTPGAASVQGQFAALAGGALNTATGAGPNSTATAVGNSLTVQVTGSWNTVVVSATQTNNATVTAQAGAGSAVTAQQKVSGNGQ